MPFALILVGVVLIVAAVRNTVTNSATTPGLVTLVKGDFTGNNNFTYWMVVILVLGALGYIDAIKPLSRIFMALVIVVLFLSNGGFFAKFSEQAFGNNTVPSNTVSNLPVNASGIIGTFTGDPNYLPSLGIENPLASGRNH
jgi:hypothetical protein